MTVDGRRVGGVTSSFGPPATGQGSKPIINKTLFLRNAAVRKSRVGMDKVIATWTLNVKGI